uniref:Uncharacterized protein n=1 Tax=Globodera rostochiensis TaxID=31243 RepID=A0A914HL11_GLORO
MPRRHCGATPHAGDGTVQSGGHAGTAKCLQCTRACARLPVRAHAAPALCTLLQNFGRPGGHQPTRSIKNGFLLSVKMAVRRYCAVTARGVSMTVASVGQMPLFSVPKKDACDEHYLRAKELRQEQELFPMAGTLPQFGANGGAGGGGMAFLSSSGSSKVQLMFRKRFKEMEKRRKAEEEALHRYRLTHGFLIDPSSFFSTAAGELCTILARHRGQAQARIFSSVDKCRLHGGTFQLSPLSVLPNAKIEINACTKYWQPLGASRIWPPKLRILRRAHGFGRDYAKRVRMYRRLWAGIGVLKREFRSTWFEVGWSKWRKVSQQNFTFDGTRSRRMLSKL